MSVVVAIQVIRSNDGYDEVIKEQHVIGESIGDCLDSFAPSPAEGAIFKVFVISPEALHA